MRCMVWGFRFVIVVGMYVGDVCIMIVWLLCLVSGMGVFLLYVGMLVMN